MNLTLDHYVCLSNRVRDALVVDFANDFAPAPPEYVLRATGVRVRIFFCKRVDGVLTPFDPGAGISLNYGAKRTDQVVGATSPLLFGTASFTRDATDPAKVFWQADLDLNTSAFAAAFSLTSPIELSGSIEVTEAGEEFPAAIFPAFGLHDVLREPDTPPAAAVPPYPTLPTAGRFLVANAAGTAWEQITPDEARQRLGLLALTGLTGGAAGALDALATAGGATASQTIREVLSGSVGGGDLAVSRWVLMAGTNAEDAVSYVRPDDYHASTNARVWVRIG